MVGGANLAGDPNLVEGLEEFLTELATNVATNGILTFTSTDAGTQTWDVRRSKGGLSFGTCAAQNLAFRSRFLLAMRSSKMGMVGLILRTFTDRRDDVSGMPVKEVRGYTVRLNGSRVEWEQLSAKDVASASGTDVKTGKILPKERAVVFCGPNGDTC